MCYIYRVLHLGPNGGASWTMDIAKSDSMCISRVSQLSDTMPSNYSEQFVESPSNKSELGRVQQITKAANSPQCEEEKAQQFQKNESNSLLREGDADPLGNSNGASTSPNQGSLHKMSSQSSSSSTGMKDEKDIKKEDPSSSPQNMSPLDFVSGGGAVGQSGRCDKDIKAEPTFNNSSTPSPLTFDKSATFFRNTTCNEMEQQQQQQQRSSSAGVAPPGSSAAAQIDTAGSGVGGSALNASTSPKIKTEDFGSNVANNSRNMFPFNSNIPKYSQNSAMPQGEAAGNSEPPDYMQQRNHVFVFSTQLANKSAESVIGGQFPTIIAYHCMQPSTKMFLEDFFKNSAKTTKLQRQYSLNIMNLMQAGGSPGPGTPPNWLNDCNNMGKFPPQRLNMRNNCNSGLKGNRGGGDQSQLMSDNQSCLPSNSADPANNNDNVNAKSSMCGTKCEDDMANIHSSLQGVKVPDENLTPQQRQHREEQLAKLKKMNRFLFPEMEGGSGEFHAAQFNNNAGPSDGGGNAMGHCSEGMANKMYPTGNNAKLFAPGQQGGPNLDNGPHMGGKGQHDDVSSNLRLMQSIKQEGGMRMGPGPGGMCDANMSNAKSRRQSDAANERCGTGNVNSPDMASSFNMNNSPSSDMMLAQAEWSKFHDDFKNRHSANNAPGGPLSCHPNAPISRSLSTGVTPYNMQSRPNTGPSPTNRNNNGPPPPYHQTQRSASVPIATQSPNNASPHNTDTSLPSPQASRMAFDMSSTPPNTEVTNPTSSAASTALMALTSGNNKNIFSRDMSNTLSPAPTYSNNTLVSPREFDFIEAAGGGHKAKRSSPQKCKTPPNLQNVADMESKYKNFGLNYSAHNMPAQNMRQNLQQMPPQFCRRIDNIPLNPNCNRISQNKTTTSSFDPIASLAQMSQQLGAIGGMGNSGSASGLNLMDMNSGDLMSGGPPVGRMGDPSMDHYNQMSNINSGAGGGGGRVMGQFPPDINHMLCGDGGTIDQRMLNGKMCGNFGPNSGDLRESFGGCNDMLNSNRGPMYRRGMPPNNFDHFNMSPNIHVRASAPNTIQYMPARSPHMNNMRMPPSSIELFQRYSNPPQGMGNVGGMGHPSGGPMPNDVNANVMNMFGNCNDMPTGQMGGNELGIEEHLIPNNDYMNVP